MQPATAIFLVTVVSLILYKLLVSQESNQLPGPKRWPIIGNLLDMPVEKQWDTFGVWRKLYGDIIGLKIVGRSIVILNSRKVIQELLEKRSAIYSDRPPPVLFSMWTDFDWILFTLPYGEEMHRQRRLMMQCIGPGSYKTYEPEIYKKVLRLSSQILQDPTKFHGHLRFFTASTILRLTYGYDIPDMKDRYVGMMEDFFNTTVRTFKEIGTLGLIPLDAFPGVSKIPSAFVGRKLAATISKMREVTAGVLHIPYIEGKSRLAARANSSPSIIETLIESCTGPDGVIENERSVQAVIGGTYSASYDTTFSTILTFILMMTCNPLAQRKAQEAIDELLHHDRLPDFRDRDTMPYIDALLMEVVRWTPVVPLALPHCVMTEDMYDGMKIPACSTLIPNTWACLRDEVDYPEPEAFRPERFLGEDMKTLRSDVPDPRDFAFGYGRRVCPGRHLAEAVVWIAITTMLATFNFSKAVDENGNEIEPELELISGLSTLQPKPFKCTITPRSPAATELLKNAVEHL